MKDLRPVKVAKVINEKVEVFAGYFHRWAEYNERKGDQSLGGPLAIVEREDGLVETVAMGRGNIIKFMDRKNEEEEKT